MTRTDTFIKLGVAAEKIEPGQQLEYLPSTGLVRKLRPFKTIVTIHEDGSMTEKRVQEREDVDE